MLTICTFWWGEKYAPAYVERLAIGLKRHLTEPYRFLVITDRWVDWVGIETVRLKDRDLTKHKGCFARLRLFDPEFQKKIGATDRVVSIDLDVIVTGSLDGTFYRPEPFMILQGANAANPCPYNGSLWMLRASYRPDVWTDFSLEAASKIPFYSFPDDQAWFAHKLPGHSGWKAGPQSGVYAFQKPGWPKGNDLPSDARLVCFPGARDPSQFTHLPWVRKHWGY